LLVLARVCGVSRPRRTVNRRALGPRVVASGEADFSALRFASVMRDMQHNSTCFTAARDGLL